MIDDYVRWKADLGERIGMSEDLLHVHAGLAIFLLTALLLRKRMRSWIPIGFVVALALGNELIDYGRGKGWDITSSSIDFLNTIFWPTLLFLLARRSATRG
jgi:hypothetical protein